MARDDEAGRLEALRPELAVRSAHQHMRFSEDFGSESLSQLGAGEGLASGAEVSNCTAQKQHSPLIIGVRHWRKKSAKMAPNRACVHFTRINEVLRRRAARFTDGT